MFNKTASSSVFKSHTIPGNPWQRHPLPAKVASGLTYEILEDEYNLAVGWSLADIGKTRTAYPGINSGVGRFEVWSTGTNDYFEEAEIYDGTFEALIATEPTAFQGQFEELYNRGTLDQGSDSRDMDAANYSPVVYYTPTDAFPNELARMNGLKGGTSKQFAADDNSGDIAAISGITKTIVAVMGMSDVPATTQEVKYIFNKWVNATVRGWRLDAFADDGGANNGKLRLIFDKGGGGVHKRIDFDTTELSAGTLRDGEIHIIELVLDGTDTSDMDGTLYVDGVEITKATGVAASGTYSEDSAGTFRFGRADGVSAGFFDGWWGTMLFFDGTLTAAQRTQLNTFLTNKHDLNNQLPAPGNTTIPWLAYWTFDEASGNALDSTGNGKTLTDNNTVDRVGGMRGNCADFDSSANEYFNRVSNDIFTGTGALSISLWAQRSDTGTRTLFEIGDSATDHARLHVRLNSSNLQCITAAGVSRTFDIDAAAWESGIQGAWRHLVLIKPANGTHEDLILYQDGNMNTNTTDVGTASTIDISSVGFALGNRIDGSNPFSGQIDEFGIVDAELTQDQVIAAYNYHLSLPYGSYT